MPTVAITGAGSGLGRALAIEYAHQGYTVYLMGRDGEKLYTVKHEIMKNNGFAEIVLCDVSQFASISIAFQQIGKLDVFINNAGIGIFGSVETYTNEQVEKILDTNVKGTIQAIQYAIPLIRKNKGRILTIISTAGLRGKVNESIYCASKFAVRGFTESLQKEWENESFTITAVYMGGMNTPFWSNTTHVADPTILKDPATVAKEIYTADDGRQAIYIDK